MALKRPKPLYISRGWKAFRAGLVRVRGNRCQRCGAPPGLDRRGRRLGLHGHHLIPPDVAPARVFDPTNVVLLCGSCHSIIEPRGRYAYGR